MPYIPLKKFNFSKICSLSLLRSGSPARAVPVTSHSFVECWAMGKVRKARNPGFSVSFARSVIQVDRQTGRQAVLLVYEHNACVLLSA
jgi:hypothetical protein